MGIGLVGIVVVAVVVVVVVAIVVVGAEFSIDVDIVVGKSGWTRKKGGHAESKVGVIDVIGVSEGRK